MKEMVLHAMTSYGSMRELELVAKGGSKFSLRLLVMILIYVVGVLFFSFSFFLFFMNYE